MKSQQDFDLPEPKPATRSQEELRLRSHHLWETFCYFLAAYSILHKLLIPLFLSFTKLRGSPYAQIDFWFIQPLLLSAILYFRKGMWALGFLYGSAIAFGGFEILELLQEHLVGWLAFSKILSSLPLALVCLVLMRERFSVGGLRRMVLGAVLTLIVLLSKTLLPPEHLAVSAAPVQATIPAFSTTSPSQVSSPTCGASTWSVGADLQVVSAPSIQVNECGFFPSVIVIESGTLQVSNHSAKPVNVHYMESSADGHPKSKWNLMLPPGETRVTPLMHLTSEGVGMIFSDSQPQVGIVAVRPPQSKYSWRLGRHPLTLGREEP